MLTRMFIIALGFVFSTISLASDVCENKITGQYSNPAYNGKYAYQKANVDIQEDSSGNYQMTFNVPCGTKLSPRILELVPTSCISGSLRIIEDGSSQCYVGDAPTYFLIGDELTIYTSARIHVPGFDGSYQLKRKAIQ